MTPGKFLRSIWPDKGFYCIAHPFTPAGSTKTVYMHKVFPTIGEAVTHVHEMRHRADTYFAVLSLREEQVWNPDKDNFKTGTKGAYSQRVASNMLASKASFFDLDVGPESTKYPTQRDALQALIAFCTKAKLPMPTLVSSGGGVHVYWPYAEAVNADDWVPIAWHMRQLADGLGLKVDTTRTVDTTSVLRVPDTFNWKDRANPRPVVVLQEGATTPISLFKQIVSDAMIANGIVATDAPVRNRSAPATPHALGPQQFNDFGPPPTIEEVGAACAQVREMLRAQTDKAHPHYGDLDNTAWYRGLLGTLKHVEDGDNWCHKITNLHPRTNADVDAKLLQLEQFPPARCETLQQFMPWRDAPCQGCRFLNDPSVPNPIAAARRTTKAPPPGQEAGAPPPPPPPPQGGAPFAQLVPPGSGLQSALIPDPPWPYERLKTGEVAITRKDKDGNTSTSVILSHDLYPIKRLSNRTEGVEQQLWCAVLPRSGKQEFIIDADVLYDTRKFCSAVSNNGVYPNKADISALQDYMVAYISQLQKQIDADKQISHLGWDDGYNQFVLPDKTLMADGTVRISALTEGAKRSAQALQKRGDLKEQIKLLQFYDHPAYIPNQSVVLDAFASIIYYATGHSGIVVNCSGDAGASKSTTLYTAASVWGDPKLWPINGTNRGATANARAQRIATNANLPTPVDEITHLPVREAIDLVMNITQPGHRLRLSQNGTEQANDASYKSAIMIATANTSLHALLSTDNAAGTAGSMRVFEMKFVAQHVHTKAQADDYLRQLSEHHGHLGEVFAHFVVRNRVAVEKRVHELVRQIDSEARIQSSERFWSARVACNLVAGEICKALGLVSYNIDALRDWSINRQIPYMRGIVGDEYRDPLAVLSDYIAEKHGNIVVVDKATAIGVNTSGVVAAGQNAFNVNNVNGALLGHYDIRGGVLYLLKQGFKDHCHMIGASSSRIIDELHQPRPSAAGGPDRIVIDKSTRRTLGAGTALAKGQTWCIAINMNHPEMSGAVSLQAVPPAPAPAAPEARAAND